MAIDFGRMARGIATGYLSAKIANTEANDRLKEDIIRGVGENYINNTLPEFQKRERTREETYNKVAARYNTDIAEYMDQNGFIAGNTNDFANIVEMLGANNNFKETELKAYLEATQAGTYAQRAEKRFQSIADQENFIMNNMTKSGFGAMTIKNQLGLGERKEEPMAPTAPEAVAPVPPEEDTTTTKLPSFEEIFGDTVDSKNVYLNMDREDAIAYKKLSNEQFEKDTLNNISGMRTLQAGYKEDYNNLSDEEKRNTTLVEYSRERYFREKFLPSQGLSYSTPEPTAVTQAKYTINILRAADPNDPRIEDVKNDLRKILGTNNLSDYGL